MLFGKSIMSLAGSIWYIIYKCFRANENRKKLKRILLISMQMPKYTR